MTTQQEPFPLDLSPDTIVELGRQAVELVARQVAGLPDAPASDYRDVARLSALVSRAPADGPGDFAALIETFRQAAEQGVNTAGPGYLAYFPAGGLVSSALAELLAQAANRYTGVAQTAPALVAMEEGVLSWLAGRFGLPAGAGGVVTTGASAATLSAVVAARHARLGPPSEDGGGADGGGPPGGGGPSGGTMNGTMYVTEHTHYSLAKAAQIAGLPAGRVRVVPTTADLRMDAGAAAAMIAADRAAGLRPFLLAGTAGSTSTGTIDRLGELGRLAREQGMWFHVDAAYGGGFQLTSRGRAALAGIEAADSITFDPHKSLFLPYGTGVLLVRDPAVLRAAHAGGGEYLQDLHEVDGLPDYGQLGVELTREFRGLRLWLPLHLHGVRAFEEALDEKLDLAGLVHRELSGDPRLEVPREPDLTVVLFRLRGCGDERNRRLLAEVNASRRVYLSSTTIGGAFYLRLCVLSCRTGAGRIKEALRIIRSAC
ncbi:pyridoxal phosphate-dependent decarboxylase family protein [Nonomuraea zeae]|uniref:Aminotransferase class V-fold PLP-dependent enzyme n=1 Tax=Nonomuraea zeae TaxID=1642303 RepID=A0A5S4G5K9_9ACTN|nr:aminotransferase class V-fold PLP-dependent enzyme [Nonomuraea zeae]TMR28295.1 aminotransferase class V-fold PLP-dependent enzyme [Nonomuraea zeae]